jgi:hypothetical protein
MSVLAVVLASTTSFLLSRVVPRQSLLATVDQNIPLSCFRHLLDSPGHFFCHKHHPLERWALHGEGVFRENRARRSYSSSFSSLPVMLPLLMDK